MSASTATPRAEPRIIGVRHHSPACARLVRHAIEQQRPRFVLIEGPADMNERLDELDAEHALPIAIYSFHHDAERSHASWSPFCDYSPEWVALREGRRIGADVRFIDLPAWTPAFEEIHNRYGDGERPRLDYVHALCQRLGIDGMDGLWDHLFELETSPEVLEARLGPYFDALRSSGGDDPSDRARETFMARFVAAAMRESGDVLVVCGGYHKPFLERAWRDAEGEWPDVPQPGRDARHGSYLVPYSFHRLDAFVGYHSGMPSPGFYQAVWEQGMGAASETMLQHAIARLRERRQVVSAADAIAAQTMTRALMRLRGHAQMARVDVLDGMAAALLKRAQDAPLPWTERGPLRRGTDPIVVEIVAALCGEREGTLAAGTPQPPLVDDAKTRLARLGLTPEDRVRTVELDLTAREDLERSRLLHRLSLLRVSGFEQQPARDVLDESWSIGRPRSQESDLVEAGAWGGTVETAAAARLEEALGEHDDVARLAAILRAAAQAGLLGQLRRAAGRMREAIERHRDVGPLGQAMAEMLAMWRHGGVSRTDGEALLADLLAMAFDRGLWLFETLQGASAPLELGHVRIAAALRDCVRVPEAELALERTAARGVMVRRLHDPDAPLAVRGAALGFLWSLHALGTPDEAREQVAAAVRSSAEPTRVGDFLTGLFGLAREQIGDEPELLRIVDRLLRELGPEDFLTAVPGLRMAFGFFPPREKDRIAQRVLQLHGFDPSVSHTLRTIPVASEVIVAAGRLEAAALERARRYGLLPREPEDSP